MMSSRPPVDGQASTNEDENEAKLMAPKQGAKRKQVVPTTSEVSPSDSHMQQQQPQQMPRRARGVLALIASGDDAIALPYYPYQPSILSASSSSVTTSAAIHRGRRRRRERQQQRPDLEIGHAVVGPDADDTVRQPTPYDHEASEFTLLYFADSTCRNCLRFNPILARFLRSVNRNYCNGGCDGSGEGDGVAADHHRYCQDGMERTATSATASTSASDSRREDQAARKIVQCICVPNDTTEKGADAICQGLGTHCLPFHHKNRLALIRYVLVSWGVYHVIIVIRLASLSNLICSPRLPFMPGWHNNTVNTGFYRSKEFRR